MDTAKRCREQSDECLRLMNLAQSDTEARILRDLAHSWVRIANQTERYAKFIAVQSAGYFVADGTRLFDPAKFGLPSALKAGQLGAIGQHDRLVKRRNQDTTQLRNKTGIQAEGYRLVPDASWHKNCFCNS